MSNGTCWSLSATRGASGAAGTPMTCGASWTRCCTSPGWLPVALLPESFGSWTPVWSPFRRWSRNGTWAEVWTVVHAVARRQDGRADETPSMVVIDTHLARGASNGGFTFHDRGRSTVAQGRQACRGRLGHRPSCGRGGCARVHPREPRQRPVVGSPAEPPSARLGRLRRKGRNVGQSCERARRTGTHPADLPAGPQACLSPTVTHGVAVRPPFPAPRRRTPRGRPVPSRSGGRPP